MGALSRHLSTLNTTPRKAMLPALASLLAADPAPAGGAPLPTLTAACAGRLFDWIAEVCPPLSLSLRRARR